MTDTYTTIEIAQSTRLDHVQRVADRADKAHRKGKRTEEQRALSALEVAVREVEAYVSTETE